MVCSELVSLPMCYLQRISSTAEWCCLQRISFIVESFEIALSTANLWFAAKSVFCSEFVIRCRNWVGCNKLTIAAELCVLQWIWDSLPKLYGLQRISNSLLKLSCLQRINICHPIVCPATNLGFAAEVVWSTANFKFAVEIELFAAN